ncbi:Indole-3-glycerol phosphate synthase [Legionella massiliensis]|uniref:Indole-3-glycerol phosphate synthase n=1 Tax=Legionella massiliensis TaxID=1034943 RepID=A0A078L424_9GAMM|nr:indole-3-glycerol phosphate synthase TrpC [Legionella massiliensis]CDZ78693.1 Indole-3-glycerol phosphate synthase [Legionella massiliensis]CEE14431.1 Indole-3-glycerol phosphate synthase [Legionella massiliensis]
MTSILNRIGEHKRQEVEAAKRTNPLSSLNLADALPPRDFVVALQKRNPAIIAEIKKASPSKGLIREDFEVATIAKIYEQHGASCLSVLTDIDFFQGHPSYLAQAKTAVSLPVLRKDFIIDSYQIYESRALGADCILLIAAMLDDQQLYDYCQLAQELKMAVLVESHTLEEFQRSLPLPTPLMGVNNRSLHSFITNLETSLNLVNHLPADKILITESGINTRGDIELMQEHGINSFLIGESLMRCENIGAKLDEFMGV